MVYPGLVGFLHEGDAGPSDDGEDRQGAHDHQEPPDLADGQRVVPSVALGEERVAVWVVPHRHGLVEAFASQRKVQGLDNRMEEEQHRDRVRRQVIRVVVLVHQVEAHQYVLYEHQE